MHKDVIKFLENNGFKKIEENSFANDKCGIVYEDMKYTVSDNEGNTMYSENRNIYWLIGILTYYGFMDKNYVGGFDHGFKP